MARCTFTKRVVSRFLTQLLAHVLEQIKQAARGARTRDNAQRDAARQVPQLFDDSAGRIENLEPFAFPGGKIALLREQAQLAQPVEDLALRRVRGQPILLQVPEARIFAIAEHETPIGPEDRDRKRELIQRVNITVGIGMQPAAFLGSFREIDGGADDGSFRQRMRGERQRAAHALHDGIALRRHGLRGIPRGKRELAFGAIERSAQRRCVLNRGRADRLHEGIVRPTQAQVLVPQPNRYRKGLEDRPVIDVGCRDLGTQEDRGVSSDRTAAHREAVPSMPSAQLEGGPVLAQSVQGRGKCRSVRSRQTGIEQLRAIGEAQALTAVAVPDDDRGIRFAQQRLAQRQLRTRARLIRGRGPAAFVGSAVLAQDPGARGKREAGCGDDKSNKHDAAREPFRIDRERGETGSNPLQCGQEAVQHHGRSPPSDAASRPADQARPFVRR